MPKQNVVFGLLLMSLLLFDSAFAQWELLANTMGVSPELIGSLGPIAIFVAFIAYFFVAPIIFLVLLHKYFRINLKTYPQFLILAFVLHTGSFIGGVLLSLASLALIAIPSLIIGYIIGLLLYAAILWLNDHIIERMHWY